MIATIKTEIVRWRRTAGWSWQGWVSCWRNEKSLRQWVAVNAVSAFAALLLDLTSAERMVILGFGVLILVVELLNSAIEAAVDFTSLQVHPLAKQAKDSASAAVTVTAIGLISVWAVALLSPP